MTMMLIAGQLHSLLNRQASSCSREAFALGHVEQYEKLEQPHDALNEAKGATRCYRR